MAHADLRRSYPDSVTAHPPDVSCRSGVSLKRKQKSRNVCKPLVNHVCRMILELWRKKKLVCLGAPLPVWTLNLATLKEVQAVGELGVMKNGMSVNRSEMMGETVLRKSRFVFAPSSAVEQNVKRKPEMDRTEDGVAGTDHRFDA